MPHPENKNIIDNINNLKVLLNSNIEFPKTGIMATIGPKSFFPDKNINLISSLICEGMNIVRINLAHVNDEEDRKTTIALLDTLDDCVKKSRQPIIVTADLGGPKIRIGKVRTKNNQDDKDYVEFKTDDILIFTLDPEYGVTNGEYYGEKDSKFSLDIDINEFKINNIAEGSLVSMDDGSFRLIVKTVTENEITCIALNDWKLKKKKGVNFPGCKITSSALVRKDFDDLDWLFNPDKGVANGRIDYISLSFVKSSEDVTLLRKFLDANYHERNVRIISKIETAESVSNGNSNYPVFQDILEVSDAIMIARGDLGAEIPFQEVPEIQRKLIEITHKARKPVIVATQMLEFMVDHDFATRAEVTDVTNAILEGADVTMLSAETSNGINPVAAVSMMQKIVKQACTRVLVLPDEKTSTFYNKNENVVEAIAHPVVKFAEKLGAKLIVSFTHTGLTPIAISHYRPKQPVIAITYNPDTVAKLGLYQGIYTVLINYVPKNSNDHREVCQRILQETLKLTNPGDLSVVTLSMDPEAEDKRETNSLYVLRHGEKR